MWWPFQKKSIQTKAVLGTSNALGAFLQFGSTGAETPGAALHLYERSTAVSIPINKVAEAFASIEPVLEFMDTGEIVTQHALLDKLRMPSPFYDGCLFLETLAKNYLITNEAIVVALGRTQVPPLELQPLSPSHVSVIEGGGGLVTSFDVSGNTLNGAYALDMTKGQARYFDGGLRELKQIRGFSTRNNGLLRGQSLLVPAAAEARQHIMGNAHNISLLEKGGRLSYVFHYNEDVAPDDFDELKRRVQEEVGGFNQAGAIQVSTGGKLDVKEMGTNNKDMDYVNLQRQAMNSVALQIKCPLPLISNDASTFNNYAAANLALYDDAVLPLGDRLYSGLSQFLLPRYGLDPAKVKITYNILTITALRSRVLAEIKTRAEINIESDNELRVLLGQEGYSGGNTVLKPANLIPVGVDPLDEPSVSREDE